MKYFTKAQIEEIRKQLATLGVRDTDLPPVSEMTGEEIVAIVQDGINKQVGISRLFRDFLPDDIAQQLVNGKSAYEVAVDNGFVGTEAEWLASLKGEKGAKGDTGDTGPQGPAGQMGPQGPAGSAVNVVDNLNSTSPDDALSANQGRVLKEMIDNFDPGEFEWRAATDQQLGGFKTGYPTTISGKKPVKLDASDRAYVEAGGEITVATSDNLGGIKIGKQSTNDRVYPLLLDDQQKAYVYVPWTGGDGDTTPGTDGGHWDQAFKSVTNGSTPSKPSSSNPIDGSVDGWNKYITHIPNASYVVWMTTRWVEGNGTANTWNNPWKISGDDGVGYDGDKLEFIYARTTSEDNTPLLNPNSGNPSAESIAAGKTNVQQADFVPDGWYDEANMQSVSIDSTNRVMWMCYRIKEDTEATHAQYPDGKWGNFIGPFMWSCWGRQGIDGDGIEYIFLAANTLPTGNAVPSAWTNDDHFQDREYIRSAYRGDASHPNLWFDDPVNLDAVDSVTGNPIYGPGFKQWVCIRKRYADANSVNGQPYWHAYSEPALWTYYPQDGDAGTGYVADLDNEVMAVAIKSDAAGHNYAYNYSTESGFTPEVNCHVHMYNGVSTLTCLITNIVVRVGSSTYTYGNQTWVTYSGTNITVSIPEDDLELKESQLQATITVSASVPDNDSPTGYVTVTRDVILTVVGVQFGTDGTSYDLRVSHRTIHRTNGSNQPANGIDVAMVAVRGATTLNRYTPTSQDLPSGFSFRYKKNDDTGYTNLLVDTISVSDVIPGKDLVIQLMYNNLLVDQETIPLISDGQDADPSILRFKSVVFKRSATQPSVANLRDVNKYTGSGQSTLNPNYGGTFLDPVPYGWSDGIPDLANTGNPVDERLWMTTRIFAMSADGGNVPSQYYQAGWTDAKPAGDTETEDREYAKKQGANDDTPSTPAEGENGNMHGCVPSSNQVWFDPDLDSSEDFTQMYWQATRPVVNGVKGDWTILRIKGEQGDPGIPGVGTNGENSIALDLTNEMDSILYTNDGVRLTDPVTTDAILYDGGEAVPLSQVSYSLTYEGGISSSDVAMSGRTITVSDLSDSGSVIVSASYLNEVYRAKFTVKKIVNQAKYDLLVDTPAVLVNTSTATPNPSEITIQVKRSAQDTSGGFSVDILSALPSVSLNDPDGTFGLSVRVNNQSVSYRSSAATINVGTAVASYAIELVKTTKTTEGGTVVWVKEILDKETIPVLTVSNGTPGTPGTPGTGIDTNATTVLYGLSSSENTPPGVNDWVSWDDINEMTLPAGWWLWSKITYVYTDGTSKVVYAKTRIVSQPNDGLSLLCPFRGVYDATASYFGDTTRTDIVYYDPTDPSLNSYRGYYRANPTAQTYCESQSPRLAYPFVGQAPIIVTQGVAQVNTTFWHQLESYDNLATGFAFIEDLVVMKLNTAGEGEDAPNETISISGNNMAVYDSDKKMRVNITADPIDLSPTAIPYPMGTGSLVSLLKTVKFTNGSGSGTLKVIIGEFSVSNNSSSISYPAIYANIVAGATNLSTATITSVWSGILTNDQLSLKVVNFTGTLNSELYSISSGEATLNSGNYLVAIEVNYTYSVNRPGQSMFTIDADPINIDVSGYTSLGSVMVVDMSENYVKIGMNGAIFNLGGGFYASFETDPDNQTPAYRRKISLMGASNGAAFGIRITGNGIEKKNLGDSDWTLL